MLADCTAGLLLSAERDLACTFDGSTGTAETLAYPEIFRIFSRRWLMELCRVEDETKSAGLALSLTGDMTLLLQVLAPSSSLAARLLDRRSRMPLPSVLASRRESRSLWVPEDPLCEPVLIRNGWYEETELPCVCSIERIAVSRSSVSFQSAGVGGTGPRVEACAAVRRCGGGVGVSWSDVALFGRRSPPFGTAVLLAMVGG